MTVIEVLGRGEQKGIKLQYRGGTMDVDLLPKLKIEIYVEDGEVDCVMKTICDAGRESSGTAGYSSPRWRSRAR